MSLAQQYYHGFLQIILWTLMVCPETQYETDDGKKQQQTFRLLKNYAGFEKLLDLPA